MQVSKFFIDKIPAIKYLLNSMEPGKKHPLVLFLHGKGDEGDGTSAGLDKLLNSDNHKNLLTNSEANGWIVLAPQFVQKLNDYYLPEWAGGAYVLKALNWAVANMPVDISRIYLTGLSGGGGGAWDAITRSAEITKRFAAVVPICGTQLSDGNWKLPAETNLPIWAFHATDDGTVGVSASRLQVGLVNSYKPNPAAKYTEYPSGGHYIWGRVYGDSALYTWLGAQKRSINPDPEPQPDPLTVQQIDFSGKRVLLSDGKYRNLSTLDYDLKQKAYLLLTTAEDGDDTFIVPL